MANTYMLIASNVLSSPTSSVTFSSIPSTYTDLVLKISAKASAATGSTADFAALQFNGSTSSVWSGTVINGNGATASSSRSPANQVYDGDAAIFPYVPGGAASVTANSFSNGEVYIPNYASTSLIKPYGIFNVIDNNQASTAIFTRAHASLFNSTSAISSIKIVTSGGGATNYDTGSSFYLYGIKNS